MAEKEPRKSKTIAAPAARASLDRGIHMSEGQIDATAKAGRIFSEQELRAFFSKDCMDLALDKITMITGAAAGQDLVEEHRR